MTKKIASNWIFNHPSFCTTLTTPLPTSANYSRINLIGVSQSTAFCFQFKGFCDINEHQIKDPDRLFNSPFNQFQHKSPLMCLITKVNSLSVTNCANKKKSDWNTWRGLWFDKMTKSRASEAISSRKTWCNVFQHRR